MQDALDAATVALGTPPAAVVTQAALRGASGVQLCRLLRAELPSGEIPLVIVSDEDERAAAFEARAAGADHVRDVDALLAALPAIVARSNVPLGGHNVNRQSLANRLPTILDRALYEGEIAAEVRALASVDGLEAMFEGLIGLASQVLSYSWLALVVTGDEPRFLLHAGRDHEDAEREAREALDLLPSVSCGRSSQLAPPGATRRVAIEMPIFFGDSQVGQLAIAVSPTLDRATKKSVGLVAYELGGPLKIMALLDQVQRQAGTDALTGIMNRRAFLDSAAREQARSARHGHEISVLIVDVDHFKSVNDAHGHAAGDLVLRGVSGVLASATRRADILCRWGGEEFVVALPQTDLAGALVAAERIRSWIARTDHHLSSGATLGVTASIGVSSAPAPWGIEEVVAAADIALYDAKHHGRNRVCASPVATRVALMAITSL
jgi:diguanylate cyclase (GGDEF)-like protein